MIVMDSWTVCFLLETGGLVDFSIIWCCALLWMVGNVRVYQLWTMIVLETLLLSRGLVGFSTIYCSDLLWMLLCLSTMIVVENMLLTLEVLWTSQLFNVVNKWRLLCINLDCNGKSRLYKPYFNPNHLIGCFYRYFFLNIELFATKKWKWVWKLPLQVTLNWNYAGFFFKKALYGSLFVMSTIFMMLPLNSLTLKT